MLDDKYKITMLKDFYESLLTDKQRDILSMHYEEDYSLSEIAEDLNISKAAVSDLLKRTIELLNNYESKLELLKKYNSRSIIYEEILNNCSDAKIKDLIQKLKESE